MDPFLFSPPVTPYSEPEEIRAWIDYVSELKERFVDDPMTLQEAVHAEETAVRWLWISMDRSQSADGEGPNNFK